ncbi:hypothetical protein ACVQK1_01030 [Edwardsiella tarda]
MCNCRYPSYNHVQIASLPDRHQPGKEECSNRIVLTGWISGATRAGSAVTLCGETLSGQGGLNALHYPYSAGHRSPYNGRRMAVIITEADSMSIVAR